MSADSQWSSITVKDTTGASQGSEVKVLLGQPPDIPNFDQLPEPEKGKALAEWLKMNAVQSVPVNGVEAMEGIQMASNKRPRNSTPTTPASRSVDSSPRVVPKWPCVEASKSLQVAGSPTTTLLPAGDAIPPSASGITIIPVDPKKGNVVVTPRSHKRSISLDRGDTTDSLIASLRQLESGFGDKISDMNKILHDTKTGLFPLVESLSTEVNAVLRPSLTSVQNKVETLEQTTIPSLQKEQTSVIKPAIKQLQLDLTDPAKGVVAHLKRLEEKINDTSFVVADRPASTEHTQVKKTYTVDGQEETQLAKLQQEMQTIKSRLDSQEVSLSIVSSWSDVMFRDITSLQDQLHHNTACHMQTELVVGGIKQVKKENCKRAVAQFFQNKVKVAVNPRNIWSAFRKGSGTTKIIDGRRIRCPPQMVVHLAQNLRDDVMRNAKNLKGLVDPEGQYKYYVFPHLPEAFRAARAKYKEKMDSIIPTST